MNGDRTGPKQRRQLFALQNSQFLTLEECYQKRYVNGKSAEYRVTVLGRLNEDASIDVNYLPLQLRPDSSFVTPCWVLYSSVYRSSNGLFFTAGCKGSRYFLVKMTAAAEIDKNFGNQGYLEFAFPVDSPPQLFFLSNGNVAVSYRFPRNPATFMKELNANDGSTLNEFVTPHPVDVLRDGSNAIFHRSVYICRGVFCNAVSVRGQTSIEVFSDLTSPKLRIVPDTVSNFDSLFFLNDSILIVSSIGIPVKMVKFEKTASEYAPVAHFGTSSKTVTVPKSNLDLTTLGGDFRVSAIYDEKLVGEKIYTPNLAPENKNRCQIELWKPRLVLVCESIRPDKTRFHTIIAINSDGEPDPTFGQDGYLVTNETSKCTEIHAKNYGGKLGLSCYEGDHIEKFFFLKPFSSMP